MSTEFPAKATVTQTFTQSPEAVFDAWLDTGMISRFMFGPALRDEEIVSLKTDARVGGSFSFIVRRKGMEIDHIGEYLEIDRPHRLVFTWAVRQDLPDSSRVVINITPAGTGSELTLTQEMPANWADFIDSAKGAWSKMLTALAGIH
ncbi:SRPBCC family protein [Chitinophaga sp. MM2321]|uniref:SRPBCC family protein n=1 Tax=Chitinophaga sp. MM2321 TaxID=3137178 RepID=UPI0032D5A6FA